MSDRERKRRQRRSAHNTHLRKTYGITIHDYDTLLASQGGSCAICGGGTSKRHFAVDHNHRTGAIRGLLCARCNSGLAKFMDKRENVRLAYEYLGDDGATVATILGRQTNTMQHDFLSTSKRGATGETALDGTHMGLTAAGLEVGRKASEHGRKR